MKQIRRCTKILILSLLVVSVLVPIFLLSDTLTNFNFEASEEYIEDLSSIKSRNDAQILSLIEKEEGEILKEPPLDVYKDGKSSSVVNNSFSEGKSGSEQSGNAKRRLDILERNGTEEDTKQVYQQVQQEISSATSGQKHEQSKQTSVQQNQNVRSKTGRVLDEKVKEMKDQLIRAKVYLNLAPPSRNSQLVRELKLRIRELARAVGDSTKDSDLSKSALHRMRAMEATLSKANRAYPDCPVMATKLRAMTYDAEEQGRTQKNHARFLINLAGRTTPKGLHCLSMKLTAEYFSLQPEEREFSNQPKLHDTDLYHFAVFSDNVLACAVVVNSTVSTSSEPEKIVFHVVTDSINLPAMSMWFLLNPPGKSTIQIQSIDSFEWLSADYGAMLQKHYSDNPRYTSALNHLRFYLPDIFPLLNKIVLLDHDVVVQKDLKGLWNVNMMGKVNGAVETCQEDETSFLLMDTLLNFSDQMVAERFDRKACTWAFGMNVFDLQEWTRQNLTEVYHKYLQLGYKRPLWKAGSLPLGWVTFYNHTVGLDRTWHLLGLGYDSGVRQRDIKGAAVIHFDGTMKPWSEIGIEKYKDYWRRHVNFEHPYLQNCNIHR